MDQNLSPRLKLNPGLNPFRRRFPALVLVLLLASGGPDPQCSPGHDAGYGGGWSCPDGYDRKTHLHGNPTCEKKRPHTPRPVPRETM